MRTQPLASMSQPGITVLFWARKRKISSNRGWPSTLRSASIVLLRFWPSQPSPIPFPLASAWSPLTTSGQLSRVGESVAIEVAVAVGAGRRDVGRRPRGLLGRVFLRGGPARGRALLPRRLRTVLLLVARGPVVGTTLAGCAGDRREGKDERHHRREREHAEDVSDRASIRRGPWRHTVLPPCSLMRCDVTRLRRQARPGGSCRWRTTREPGSAPGSAHRSVPCRCPGTPRAARRAPRAAAADCA